MSAPRAKISNWEDFQHYKTPRSKAWSMPWLKLYREMLQSEDWLCWSDASRLLAIVCLLAASRKRDGSFPLDPTYLKRFGCLEQDPDFKPLIDSGFLEAADGRSLPDSASDESRDKASGRENQKKGVAKDKSSNPRRSPARFVPPSLEEVRAYCESKGYSFDPEAFHAFYESKGWKVGKNPMKSWKAACVTWQKRREKDGPVNGNPASNHTQTPEGGEWVVYTYRQADLDEHGKKEDWSEYLDYAMGCEPETAEPYNTWRSNQ
jgi:hypothetical protein